MILLRSAILIYIVLWGISCGNPPNNTKPATAAIQSWGFQTNIGTYGFPLLSDSVLYLGTQKGLYAFAIEPFSLLWKAELGSPWDIQFKEGAALSFHADTILFAHGGGLDYFSTKGKLLRSIQLGANSRNFTFAPTNHSLYFYHYYKDTVAGFENAEGLTALDLQTGKMRWSSKYSKYVLSTNKQYVFAETLDYNWLILNAQTGKLERELDLSAIASRASTFDHQLDLLKGREQLFLFDNSNFSLAWKSPSAKKINSFSPSVWWGNTLLWNQGEYLYFNDTDSLKLDVLKIFTTEKNDSTFSVVSKNKWLLLNKNKETISQLQLPQEVMYSNVFLSKSYLFYLDRDSLFRLNIY